MLIPKFPKPITPCLGITLISLVMSLAKNNWIIHLCPYRMIDHGVGLAHIRAHIALVLTTEALIAILPVRRCREDIEGDLGDEHVLINLYRIGSDVLNLERQPA